MKLVEDLITALVSSPSELSAAPKGTVTPVREAILKEAIIREVLDWIKTHYMSWDNRDVMLAGAREHFGVSS